jgi:hypothetical protein
VLGQALSGGGHHISQAQTELEASALKHAQCTRRHGLPNHPDPTFDFSRGGVSQKEAGAGLDPRSLRFQAAQNACQNVRASSG